ncbi:MAG: PilZ domain-containing protein, partial [Candidatus Hydrogenedentota bacterium]
DEDTPDIRKNNECLVNLMGQHFLSRILDVSEDRLTIAFPGKDYPASGMHLELQFHDEEGFNCYQSQVVAGPLKHPGVVVIKRPKAMDRRHHRQHCRVPTDLTVQIKEQSHVRRYDAALTNLSGGGALLETDAPVDFNSSIEITLSVPRDKTRTIQGHVIHVDRPKAPHDNGRSTVGVRFVHLDSETAKAITDYVWQRLRELYPGE